MQINFFDVAQFHEFHDATLLHKQTASNIDFVLYIEDFALPKQINSSDLLVISTDCAHITPANLALLQEVCCAGVIIFAPGLQPMDWLDHINLSQNFIVSSQPSIARPLIQKITLTIGTSLRDHNTIKGVVDGILFQNENYALLDWLYLLNLMEIDIFAHYRVAVIKVDDPTLQADCYHKLRHYLTTHDSLKLHSVWQNILVCILPDDNGHRRSKQAIKHAYNTLSETEQAHVKIALGNVYEGLETMQKSFCEALRTFDMIDLLAPADHICSYRMLGIYCILYELNDPEVFAKYYNSLFESIWRYDRKMQTNLFETLDVYFAHDCDLDRTAQALYIHKNTLRYRLKKIEEVLGSNLQNINTITEIVTAFKIRRLNNILQ